LGYQVQSYRDHFSLDEEGMLAVPTGPGMGIELDWAGIERLSVDLD
jgi:L-alanine-DL-glutamate epimerase-like enolase superfamily enzyme